jgi:hypothetical protein
MRHKFKVGQMVSAAPKARRTIPTGDYEVIRQLPADAEGFQYQVKSIRDGHQRVVHEADLVEVGG